MLSKDILKLGKILVTGGGGFIGRGIVSKLVLLGACVRVLDNNSRGNSFGLPENVEYINGDIRDFSIVDSAFSGIDTVFHFAYINGTENFYKRPGLVVDVALKGLVNTIDAAKIHNVKNYIFASSSEVYQTPDIIPTPEDVSLVVPNPFNPRYTYGGGKIIGELAVIHSLPEDCRKIIMRPHNVYGPNMGYEHVIPQLTEKILMSSDVEVYGGGRSKRAFCFIDDAVDGIVLAAIYGAGPGIYNVGSDELEISIADLAFMIADILGIDINIKEVPSPSGEAERRCPDISALKKLGYEPKVSLGDGLRRTVNWYKERYKR